MPVGFVHDNGFVATTADKLVTNGFRHFQEQWLFRGVVGDRREIFGHISVVSLGSTQSLQRTTGTRGLASDP